MEIEHTLNLEPDENIIYKAFIKKNIFEMPYFYLICVFILIIIIDISKCIKTTDISILNLFINIAINLSFIYMLLNWIIDQIHTDVFLTPKRIIIKKRKYNIYCNKQDVQYIDKNKIICNDEHYYLHFISDFGTFKVEFLETLNEQEKENLKISSEKYSAKKKFTDYIKNNQMIFKGILFILCLIIIIKFIFKGIK